MPILRVSQRFYDRVKQIQAVLSDLTERVVSPAEITDKLLLTVVVSEQPAVMLEGNTIIDDFGWGIKPIIIQVNSVKRRANQKASIEFERAIRETPKLERTPMAVTNRFKDAALETDYGFG